MPSFIERQQSPHAILSPPRLKLDKTGRAWFGALRGEGRPMAYATYGLRPAEPTVGGVTMSQGTNVLRPPHLYLLSIGKRLGEMVWTATMGIRLEQPAIVRLGWVATGQPGNSTLTVHDRNTGLDELWQLHADATDTSAVAEWEELNTNRIGEVFRMLRERAPDVADLPR